MGGLIRLRRTARSSSGSSARRTTERANEARADHMSIAEASPWQPSAARICQPALGPGGRSGTVAFWRAESRSPVVCQLLWAWLVPAGDVPVFFAKVSQRPQRRFDAGIISRRPIRRQGQIAAPADLASGTAEPSLPPRQRRPVCPSRGRHRSTTARRRPNSPARPCPAWRSTHLAARGHAHLMCMVFPDSPDSARFGNGSRPTRSPTVLAASSRA